MIRKKPKSSLLFGRLGSALARYRSRRAPSRGASEAVGLAGRLRGGFFSIRLGLAALIAVIYLGGGFEAADLKLLDARYALIQRAAQSDVVIVAIDPESLHRIGYWPWPRSLHAFLLKRLTEEKAARVALDVDFSSRSRDSNDEALERALAAFPGEIILPGFVQHADPLRPGGALISTLPLDRFLPHVTLASVNVVPDEDGLVRRMSTTSPLGGRSVPTLSSVLAQNGSPKRGDFAIDFGIRLQDIPSVSYADVLVGDFEAGLFEGRTVLVGATAFELGDVLPVPVYDALPGIMVQALAAETLSQGRALVPVSPAIVVSGIFVLSLLLGACFRGGDWKRGLLLTLWFPPLLFLASCLLHDVAPISLDIVAWIFAVLGAYAVNVFGILHRQNAHLLAQRFALLRKDRFMNSVVEHTFDAIVTVDPEGKITTVNRSAKSILADPEHDLKGRDIGDFVLNSESGAAKPCTTGDLERIAAKAEPCELLGRRSTGKVFPLDAAVSCFAEKQRTTYIVLLRDITARKDAEAKAEASRQELITAKERAETADRAKSQFLANVSHELRTPLNAVIGFSELMKEQIYGPLGARKYLNYAEDIHESGIHLLTVINDILDLSRIESGSIAIREECFRFDTTIEACLRMVAARAELAGITLESAEEPLSVEVCGDERLIKQALLNVLSNAIKFTPDGGVVTLAIAQEESGAVSVSVTDTGAGIAEEDLSTIFQPFQQVDSSLTRPFEGTGLGLPLTKSFMELHGGRIEIDSEVGEGTRVTLTLPPERNLSSPRSGNLRLVVP